MTASLQPDWVGSQVNPNHLSEVKSPANNLVKQVYVQLSGSSFSEEGRQISVQPKLVDNEDMCLMHNISQHV